MACSGTLCRKLLDVKDTVVQSHVLYTDADGVTRLRIRARPNAWHRCLCSLRCGRFRHYFWTVVAFILDGVVGCGIGHRCRPVS